MNALFTTIYIFQAATFYNLTDETWAIKIIS